MADGPMPPGVPEVKSAARTIEVLELMAARGARPLSIRELAEALGMPRSSAYALLQTLVRKGWVRCDASGSFYALGVRALLVGTSYIDRDPRATLARPFLDRLSETLDETTHFARLDGWDVVYLLTMESSRHRRPFARVGRRLPAHATALGKAVLAGHTVDDIDGSIPATLEVLTPQTIDTRKALLAELSATRERGYAVDREENTPGVCCVAMAFRYDDPPIDAFSCSIPARRFTPDLELKVVDAMNDVRHEIEDICRAADRHGLVWRYLPSGQIGAR